MDLSTLAPELQGALIGGVIGVLGTLGASWLANLGARSGKRADAVREAYVELLAKLDALEPEKLRAGYRSVLRTAIETQADGSELVGWLDAREAAFRVRYQATLKAFNNVLLFDRSRSHRGKVQAVRVWLTAYATGIFASTAEEVASADFAHEQRSELAKAELALRKALSGSRHLF